MNYNVSVIVPVYNVELYIEQCLKSIFNQTLKNIQVIIVNDGSTDKSETVINKFIGKYDNVEYINQKNQGVSISRNTALKYVKGEYVLFVDPDDYLAEDCIEKMYKKANNIDADIVISGYKKVFDDTIAGIDEDIILELNHNNIYEGKMLAEKMLELEISGYLWDKLFKKSFLDKYDFGFEPKRYVQDWYPVFKQIYHSRRVGIINEPLYYYRQRGTSTVNKNNNKLIQDFHYATSSILKYVELNNLDLDQESIIAFKSTTFNSLIKMYSKLNQNSKIAIYSNFNKDKFDLNEPTLLEILLCKKTTFRTKVSIILWKMRVRALLFNC